MKHREIETKIMNSLIGSAIPVPEHATEGSAAMDIRACIESPVMIKPGETVTIPSGIAIGIHDPGVVAILAPRSGLGIKHGIVLANSIGIIDSDYQGEIIVGLRNQGLTEYTVEPGERICQMMFIPVVQASLRIVEHFSEYSSRGSGRFGHTGRL